MTTRFVQRGWVGPAGPPGDVIQVSGPNFAADGETHERSYVSVNLEEVAVSWGSGSLGGWRGIHGFCIVEPGATVPNPTTSLLSRWLWWGPLTHQAGNRQLWYDAGLAGSRSLPDVGLLDHFIEVPHKVVKGGSKMWWSADLLGQTPASSARVWFSWVTVSVRP